MGKQILEVVHLYRHQNPDGTSKDWAYPARPPADTLPVYFGRTGTQLHLTHTPGGRCVQGSPTLEAARRAKEKVAKGYQFLGTYLLTPDQKQLVPLAPGVPRESPSTDSASTTARSAPTGTSVWAQTGASDSSEADWFY